MAPGMEVEPQPRRLCVRLEPSPLPKNGAEPPSPIFGGFLLWPNGWMHQDATWYGGRPQPRALCVRWSPERGRSPQFSAHVYCSQTAAWIKMLLGTEVGLGPDGIVLGGDPAPSSPKRGWSPIFGPCLLCPNGWMDQGGTWHGGGPWSRPHCARWGPSYPLQKRGQSGPTQFSAHFCCGQTAGCIKMPLGMEVGFSPGECVRCGPSPPSPKRGGAPNFWPTSIVAKRLHGARCHLVRR